MGDKDNIPLFQYSEAKKSGNTWLVTVEGMTRVFLEKNGRYELPTDKKGHYDVWLL